jgi:hypothetical protein
MKKRKAKVTHDRGGVYVQQWGVLKKSILQEKVHR